MLIDFGEILLYNKGIKTIIVWKIIFYYRLFYCSNMFVYL